MTAQSRNDRLLSQRSEDHLGRLHRTLVISTRAVEQSWTRLLTAIHACDLATQRQHLAEYSAALAAHGRALAKLAAFIEHRFGIDSIGGDAGAGQARESDP